MDQFPVFAPISPYTHALSALLIAVFLVLLAILLLVTSLVIYMIIRYRDRPGAPEARQIFGWNTLEVIWTLIPIGILTVFAFFMISVDRESDPLVPPGRKPDLEVIGHQWWWEINYVASGVVAANEVHIPIGKPILIDLRSADVIHDFWAPQLGREIDAVPGHPNTLWIEAEKPGTYMGECAEFCGVEHAWMRFRVVAQNQVAFDAWQRAQLATPPSPSAPDAIAGAKLFTDKTCRARFRDQNNQDCRGDRGNDNRIDRIPTTFIFSLHLLVYARTMCGNRYASFRRCAGCFRLRKFQVSPHG
jgi:cytochrome c oxidase subunit 2